MTYKEKLQKEHPEKVNSKYVGGCKGCPDDMGGKMADWRICSRCPDGCAACWDRVIPGTEDDDFKNWTRDELISLIRVHEAREEAHDKAIDDLHESLEYSSNRINDLRQKHELLEKTLAETRREAAAYRTQAMQKTGCTCCCKPEVLVEKDKEISYLKRDITARDKVLAEKDKENKRLKDTLEFERSHKDYWYNEYHRLSERVCVLETTLISLNQDLEAEKKEHAKHHGFFARFN